MRTTVLENPWIPHGPTKKQTEFLLDFRREALLGGAAGGGKSDALLMAALQFVDSPGYSAFLFRKTYSDLALRGALMDRAAEWLGPTAAKWKEAEKTWTFPSGATLSFGYLDGPKDKYRYQGMEATFIGVDEASQIRPDDLLYLFSRLRRVQGVHVPLRYRLGSNPGGIAHDFLGERFVYPKEPEPNRVFIPALLEDNPYLDTDEYDAALRNLSEVEYAQLRRGQWIKDESGKVFKREYFERFDARDASHRHASVGRYLAFDPAYRESDSADYTGWAVYDLSTDYRLKLMETGAEKLEFPALISKIEELALRHNQDGKLRGVIVEDIGSGASAIQSLRGVADGWLAPYLASFKPGSRKKTERARDAAVWARKGCVLLPEPNEAAPWLHEASEQLFSFPHVEHDDIVDAVCMVPLYLSHVLAEGVRFRQSVNEVA